MKISGVIIVVLIILLIFGIHRRQEYQKFDIPIKEHLSCLCLDSKITKEQCNEIFIISVTKNVNLNVAAALYFLLGYEDAMKLYRFRVKMPEDEQIEKIFKRYPTIKRNKEKFWIYYNFYKCQKYKP